jgi:hypothetical protein
MTNSNSLPPDPGSDPAPAARLGGEPFRFDERVKGGSVMARVPGLEGQPADEIFEWMTLLRVRSDERLGVLVLSRHNGDLVGRPVGLFRRRLDEPSLAAVQAAVEGVAWAKLPAPRGGDVTAGQIELDYQRGDLLIQREFNARNTEFIAAMQPLMDTMTELMRSILESPVGVVQVSVNVSADRTDAKRKNLGLVIENPGSGAIVLTDPRVPPVSAGANGLQTYLRVAPATTGWSEPSWVSVPLPALPEGQPKTLVLPAGGRLELVVPWQAPSSGAYYLQGAWIDYAGPAEPVADQLPLVPLAMNGPTPLMSGPYPVRGAAFATGIEFNVT